MCTVYFDASMNDAERRARIEIVARYDSGENPEGAVLVYQPCPSAVRSFKHAPKIGIRSGFAKAIRPNFRPPFVSALAEFAHAGFKVFRSPAISTLDKVRMGRVRELKTFLEEAENVSVFGLLLRSLDDWRVVAPTTRRRRRYRFPCLGIKSR
jgi:hypothetical protein